jgi:hypothetical protein
MNKRGLPERWLKEHVEYVGDGCLIWPFGGRGDGYGNVRIDGKRTRAPQAMCRLAHGPKPFPEAVVRHFECGNGHLGCVHPAHICWGTIGENNKDKISHGTAARCVLPGELNGNAKFKRTDIVTILDRLATGETCLAVAVDYGVRRTIINDIKHGVRWQDAVNEYEQARAEAGFEKDGLTFTPSVWRKPVIVELHGTFARAA